MLRSATDLTGYLILATDGEAGRVEECYFDDEQWVLRYIVVHTQGWLLGRSVLIPPFNIAAIDWKAQSIKLNLSRLKIENSPGPEIYPPVASRLEADYFQYFSWPYYWTGMGAWGAAVPDVVMSPHSDELRHIDFLAAHLRSSREILGYQIEWVDSKKGHVVDLLIDDENWSIPFLLVRPGAFKKAVRVPSQAVDFIDWTHRRIHCHLTHKELGEFKKRAA